MGFVWAHRKRNPVNFLRKGEFPEKRQYPRYGRRRFHFWCVSTWRQTRRYEKLHVCALSSNGFQISCVSISKFSFSYLCSPHGIDEIWKFLCILFSVISGYFEGGPLCPTNSWGLQKVTRTLLCAMLALRSVAQEKEQTSATNKFANTEHRVWQDPPTSFSSLPAGGSLYFQGPSGPSLCLNEVAIDSTSPHIIPCSSQDERTAIKQLSRSPPGPWGERQCVLSPENGAIWACCKGSGHFP